MRLFIHSLHRFIYLATITLAFGLAASPFATDAKPSIVSAEKTSFQEVTSQLDPGGSIYVYLSTSQWLAGLSDRINEWRGAVMGMPELQQGPQGNMVNKAFDLVTSLVKNSGLESISGVGLSGIALEKGFYQTKFVVRRAPDSPTTGIWTLFGEKPHALAALKMLPSDTAWAGFSDMDAGRGWSQLRKQIDAADFPPIQQALEKLSAGVQQATGKSLDELLGSLGPECGAFLTLDETRNVHFPLGPDRSLEFPEPALVIALKVKDDTLFNVIEKKLQGNEQVIRTDEGGLRMRVLPLPLPLPLPVRITVARQGEYLFIASNDEPVKKMLDVKAGKLAGLTTTDEFKKFSKGMPEEGNSFGFVSERFGKVIQNVQAGMMGQAEKQGAPAALLKKLYSLNRPVASYAVSQVSRDGWIAVGHGNQEPANAIVLPLVVVPIAVVAGVTLPALTKAKSKAQSIQCVNNLKQMGLAARIYATDHDGAFPPDIAAMEGELGSPKILFCPADGRSNKPAVVNWDNFDFSETSYEYVSHGLKETTPDLEHKVLFQCRIHGHACFADGHVEMRQGPSPQR